MKRYSFLLLLLALVWGACQTDTADTPDTADATVLTSYDVYGDAFSDEGAIPVQAVAAEREQHIGNVVKIEGTVSAVCQMKGCWLTLQTGDGENIRINVAREENGDYAFTVPTDISGRRVVVHGTLAEGTLDVDTQRHLAEDAGEDIDEETLQPKKELQVTAQGVLVAKA